MTACRRRVGMVMATLALAVGVVACGGPKNTLGTTTGPCFRSLGVARETVGHGRFVGVRHVRIDRFGRRVPEASNVPYRQACVVAFKGPYRAGTVAKVPPDSAGRYALVVVETHHFTVARVVLRDQLPVRFRHL